MNMSRLMIVTGVLVLGVFVVFSSAVAGQEGASMEDVKKETKEALEAIKNYSAEQRDETVKKVKEVMAGLDKDIERLGTEIDKKWSKMDKAARENAKKTLKALRAQRNELAEWYGGIQHSSANAWEEVKSGFIKSFKTLKESFGEAAKEF